MARFDDRDLPGCTLIGSIDAFVQRLDEGPLARSLHFLAGQLHMALGMETEMQDWVRLVRERFDALQGICFECDLADGGSVRLVRDPVDAGSFAIVTDVIRDALRELEVGQAILYSTVEAELLGRQPDPSGMCVSAAAVKCAPTRMLGFLIAREPDGAAKEQAVLQYLAAISWHMKCADAAAARARAPQAASRGMSPFDMLEIMPLPCVLTDAAGRSIERNDAFEDFMGAAGLRVATGRLKFDDPYLQDSWQVALADVHVTALRESLLVPAPDGSQWRVHLVPLRWTMDETAATERTLIVGIVERHVTGGEAAVDTMMPDLDRPLTPAESEVMNQLLQGHSAKVIANARGASVNTVRSQIMSILEKTGHHNQKALIAAFAPSGFRTSVFSGFSSGPLRAPTTKR